MTTSTVTRNPWTREAGPGVAEAVIEDIAARDGVDPVDLVPSLYSVVDPDALEGLFLPTTDGLRHGRVSFEYHGYRVEITSDDGIGISRADEVPGENRTNDDSVTERLGSASIVHEVLDAVGDSRSDDGPLGDAASSVDESARRPLFDAVDPDALAALFPAEGCAGGSGAVSFPYAGYIVTVTDDQQVTVSAGEAATLDFRN